MQTDPSEMASKIQPVLAGHGYVVAAYLFGSVATGSSRPESDLDIALLLGEPVNRLDRKSLLHNLVPPLCRALRVDVHLLFLNDASYLARAQVFSKGQLLYMKDHEQLALFRMKSLSLFAEFATTMEMTRKGLQEKLRRSHG